MIAERFRQAIESQEYQYDGTDVRITISLGVVTFTKDIETREDLVKSVDDALYKAKREGRNKVVVAAHP